MNRWLTGVVLVPVALLLAAAIFSPTATAQYVGTATTVCGTVDSVTFAAAPAVRGRPTFLSIDGYTVIAFGDVRAEFKSMEALKGRRVCVSGPTTIFRGRPEMILEDASKLKEQEATKPKQ
jgi:hypothetical protein